MSMRIAESMGFFEKIKPELIFLLILVVGIFTSIYYGILRLEPDDVHCGSRGCSTASAYLLTSFIVLSLIPILSIYSKYAQLTTTDKVSLGKSILIMIGIAILALFVFYEAVLLFLNWVDPFSGPGDWWYRK